MRGVDWAFDGALAIAIPFIAWRAIASRSVRQAVVLFIALGLLSALSWARLDALDVALVEAGLGTGLTGALLMSALPWAGRGLVHASRTVARAARAAAVTSGAAWLAWHVVTYRPARDGLSSEVANHLAQSGVEHPVTAILLSFRGYDTLLEVAVLLVAAVAVRSIQRVGLRPMAPPPHDLYAILVELLVPVGVLVAGYLVWVGSHAPGGAFQAGTILAGSAVLLMLANRIRAPRMTLAVRAGLSVGPLFFVLLAGVPLAFGGRLLEYPRAWAGELVLVLETTLTIAIALDLTVFFPAPDPRDEPLPLEERS